VASEETFLSQLALASSVNDQTFSQTTIQTISIENRPVNQSPIISTRVQSIDQSFLINPTQVKQRDSKSKLLQIENTTTESSLLIRSSRNKLVEVNHKSTPLLLSTLSKLSKKTSLAIEKAPLKQSDESRHSRHEDSQLLQLDNFKVSTSSLLHSDQTRQTKSKKSQGIKSGNLRHTKESSETSTTLNPVFKVSTSSELLSDQTRHSKSEKSETRHSKSEKSELVNLRRFKESSVLFIETSTPFNRASEEVSTFISQIESPIETTSTTLTTTKPNIKTIQGWNNLDRSDNNILQLALLFPGSKVIFLKNFFNIEILFNVKMECKRF
jgi:hypothetical protein